MLATGGGIAPVLPYITGGLAPIFVIWIAPDPDATFGEIARLVRHHADARIYDTRCFGRPDTARLAIDAARAFDAEAVFCVSNPTGTRTVVNACLAEGIRPSAQRGTRRVLWLGIADGTSTIPNCIRRGPMIMG